MNKTDTLSRSIISQQKSASFPASKADQFFNFSIIRYAGQKIDDIPLDDDFFVMIFGMNGSAVADLGNYSFKIGIHHLYVVRTNSLDFFRDLSQDFGCYLIVCKKTFFLNILKQENLVEGPISLEFQEPIISQVEKSQFFSIYRLLQRLDEEFHGQQALKEKLLKLLFIELLLEVSRLRLSTDVTTLRIPSRQGQLVNRFKALIEEHFLKMRTIQEYADQLFVTAKHLGEVVKAYTGKSALHFIHKRLFEEAIFCLSNTGLTIKEIAGKLNFDTSSHFSRFFKHFSGHNPSEFQQLYLATT